MESIENRKTVFGESYNQSLSIISFEL